MDVKRKIKNLKNRCKNKNIEFNLTELSLKNLGKANRCFYLNIPLNVKNPYYKNLTKMSIDRKDCDKGYIKGNVVACSVMSNNLKNLVESGLITPEDIIKCGKKFKKIMKND